jgi:hypothetical protein
MQGILSRLQARYLPSPMRQGGDLAFRNATVASPAPASAAALRQAFMVDGFDPAPRATPGTIPTVSERGRGPYAPHQNRPQVKISKPIPALLNGAGKPGTQVDPGKWAVSAVAGNRVVLYNPRKDGDIRVVDRRELLLAAKAGPDREAVHKALRSRELTNRDSAPRGTPFYVNPSNTPEGHIKWVPPGGSSTSITGRGTPPIVWGTSTPNGPDGSRTGFAGFPMEKNQKFIATGQTRGTQWEDRDNPNSRANVTWALGYTELPNGKWVKQWVVKSITPLNGEPPIHVLTPTPN